MGNQGLGGPGRGGMGAPTDEEKKRARERR